MGDMRLGIAHHFGWAVAVTASADHAVVDRRRIELIEPDLPPAPIHHAGGPHLFHRQAEPLDRRLARAGPRPRTPLDADAARAVARACPLCGDASPAGMI